MNIWEQLNNQYSLDNLVCIASITSEQQLKKLETDGYYAAFTAQSWRKNFPSIDVKKIYCPKTQLFAADLIYLDLDHYICIKTMMLNGQYIKGNDSFERDMLQSIQILETAYMSKDYKTLLRPNASEQSGNIVIALLNKMLENEPTSAKLYETFFDFYSFVDCGAKRLTPFAIQKLLKSKTEKQKQSTLDCLIYFPEIITIYRGEGSKSTDYTQAYSWTTDINKAYFFASWKGGEKARIITAQVKKKNVIEYLTSRGESEIVVLPENIQNATVKPLCELEWFLQLLSSDFEGYSGKNSLEPFFGIRIIEKTRNIYDRFGQKNACHDCEHSSRVGLFASYIYKIMVLAEHMRSSQKTKEKYDNN